MSEETTAHRISTSDARNNLATILDAVRVKDERVIVTQHGRDVAAIIPVDDLNLLEELEDRADSEEIRRRLAESKGTISLEDLGSRLGIVAKKRRAISDRLVSA